MEVGTLVDITAIINGIIALIFALVSAFVIPWLKNKLSDHNYQMLVNMVRVGVQAAEMIYGAGKGAEKKKYVLDLLASGGFAVDIDSVDAMIEAEVLKLQ